MISGLKIVCYLEPPEKIVLSQSDFEPYVCRTLSSGSSIVDAEHQCLHDAKNKAHSFSGSQKC